MGFERPIAYNLKLAEGEGLLRPSASSLRENAFAFLSLAMPRRPNPEGFSSLPNFFAL